MYITDTPVVAPVTRPVSGLGVDAATTATGTLLLVGAGVALYLLLAGKSKPKSKPRRTPAWKPYKQTGTLLESRMPQGSYGYKIYDSWPFWDVELYYRGTPSSSWQRRITASMKSLASARAEGRRWIKTGQLYPTRHY